MQQEPTSISTHLENFASIVTLPVGDVLASFGGAGSGVHLLGAKGLSVG